MYLKLQTNTSFLQNSFLRRRPLLQLQTPLTRPSQPSTTRTSLRSLQWPTEVAEVGETGVKIKIAEIAEEGEDKMGDKIEVSPTNSRVRLGPEVQDITPHLQISAVTAISNTEIRLGFVLHP